MNLDSLGNKGMQIIHPQPDHSHHTTFLNVFCCVRLIRSFPKHYEEKDEFGNADVVEVILPASVEYLANSSNQCTKNVAPYWILSLSCTVASSNKIIWRLVHAYVLQIEVTMAIYMNW